VHIIIIGAGEVGTYLARILADERQDVCIIEQDEGVARGVSDSLDAQVLHGTGVSRRVLVRAGVERADLLLAVTEIDEVNLIAAMTAERMNPECRTVARVRNRRYLYGNDALTAEDYGIDLLLGPEEAVAQQVVSLLEYVGPGQISNMADGKLVLLEHPVQPHSALAYAALEEVSAELPSRSMLCATLSEGELRISQAGDRFQVGDRVYILAAPGEVGDVLALLGSDLHHVRRVLLIGGGETGLQVARALERLRFDVTVVERDHQRAELVAGRLKRSLVIEADGTDPTSVAEWIGEGHDTVVVLAEDDNHSLLTGIVAKFNGAKKVIARVDNQDYGPISHKLGVDALISPRRAIAATILRFVRRSHIQSTTMLGNHQGEIIDFAIDEKSKGQLMEKPLASIKLPKDCVVGVVARGGDLVMPSRDPEFTLQIGDHVFIAALRSAVAKVEELFG